jgi:hypothetical protein
MRKKRRDEGRMELIVMNLMIRFECCVFVVDLNSLAISYPRAEEQRGNIVILLYESLSNILTKGWHNDDTHPIDIMLTTSMFNL